MCEAEGDNGRVQEPIAYPAFGHEVAGGGLVARSRLTATLANLLSPGGAERVEYKCVSNRQLTGIHNNLIGIINNWIPCDTPGFVADDSFAMFASCFRAVTVAVVDGSRSFVGHTESLDGC